MQIAAWRQWAALECIIGDLGASFIGLIGK
jgi:hypothetical protein